MKFTVSLLKKYGGQQKTKEIFQADTKRFE